MSIPDKIIDQLISAGLVVYHYRGNFFTFCIAVGHHRRNRKIFWNTVHHSLMSRYIDDPFCLHRHKLLNLLLYHTVVVIPMIVSVIVFLKQSQICQKYLIVHFLTVFCNPVNNIRNTENGHIFRNDSDVSGISGFQALSNVAGHVFHLFRCFQHQLSGGFTGSRLPIQYIGNCGNRYAAFFCNFFNCGHSSLPFPFY